MSPAQIGLLIFIGGNLLWLIFGAGWPSLLILFALSLLPGVAPDEVFRRAFGHPTIAFLLFTFVLSGQLRDTGVLQQLVRHFLSIRWARRSFFRRTMVYACAVFVAGSFLAPTVCFLLFYGLLEEICEAADYEKGSPEGHILMGLTACLSSISCAATPIAHTFPLMAMDFYQAQTGESITLASYFRLALPLGLLLAGICFVVIWLIHRPKLLAQGQEQDARAQARIDEFLSSQDQPLSSAGKRSLGVFLFVLLAWILPVIPTINDVLRPWGHAWPPLLGCLVLMVARDEDKKPLLTRNLHEHVHGGSLLLCATALALGHFLALPEIGLTDLLTTRFAPILKGLAAPTLLFLIAGTTLILTNLMSNIVTTTLMSQMALPILLAISPQLGMQGAILIGFTSSLAFALPPSIAHIALAGSSGWTTVKAQALAGFWMILVTLGALALAIFSFV